MMNEFIKLPVNNSFYFLNRDTIIYAEINELFIEIVISNEERRFRYELNDTNDAKKDFYFVLEQLKEKGIIS